MIMRLAASAHRSTTVVSSRCVKKRRILLGFPSIEVSRTRRVRTFTLLSSATSGRPSAATRCAMSGYASRPSRWTSVQKSHTLFSEGLNLCN